MQGSLKRGTLLASRYRILARIGEGGYGTVYKARDRRRHGKLVAIKEINMATLSAQEKIEVTDTFNRESMLLSWLSHKSLPRIYEQFTDPEHWYIVMEYIEGQTLEELLARSRKGRLSVAQTARIGVVLCDVLSHLHRQSPSIIFRDVKPGNIMLTYWDRLYLIDFGIARRFRPGQARDTGPLGSPGYAAPEQYGRAQTTAKADIYGLGITLQTLLTGKEPLEIRLQGVPPDVRVPWKLQALIDRMTDPDPSRRPSNMAEVKETLAPYASPYASPSVPLAWLRWWPMIYLGFASMLQSHFVDSSFAGPYFLLALAGILGYCVFSVMRTWRAAPAGLSVKAAMLIAGKHVLFSLAPVGLLTGWVSLLYALLARPHLSGWSALFLWTACAVFTFLQVASFMIQRRGGYERRQRQRTSAPPSAQQQVQKRP
ncbi:MAG TPA: serine/threonine-protein kinase [Ktedonosporobacter sp.]|nr:serine/threonine-protein kinase [Ktedonosporobacter sp.]